ncbi:MAG: hypothetical protein WBN94_13205, partial [Methanothrix sp.]
VQESYEDKRIDVAQLLATSETGQVDSILLEIFNLMFSGWGLIPIPPDGMDIKEAAEKVPPILKQLWRFDKILDLKYLMGRMWADNLAFGPGLAEIGVHVDDKGNFLDFGRVDEWKGPEWANYLDATSFERQAPGGNVSNRYVEGRLLKGIRYDTQERRMEYWQTQPDGTQKQIPTGRILVIKDRRSRYVDGKSYLEGIVPTALQREHVRKNIMLQIRRAAAPAMGLRIKELRNPNGALISVAPDGKAGNRWEKAWKAGGQALKDYSANKFLMLWEEHEVIESHTTITGDIFIPDDKLKAEILNHLIPRDWIEQNGAAVSKSSQPLWDLAMLVVDGWRTFLAEVFEALLTQILEANGFADWSVEFVWKKLEYEDKVQMRTQALAAWERGAITLDRLYKIMGWDALTDEERKQLEAEKQIYHSTPGLQLVGNASLPATNVAKDKEPALDLLKQKSEIAIEELKYYGYLPAEAPA